MTETRTGWTTARSLKSLPPLAMGSKTNGGITLREANYNCGSGHNHAYFVFDKTLAQDPSCGPGVVITYGDHAGLVGTGVAGLTVRTPLVTLERVTATGQFLTTGPSPIWAWTIAVVSVAVAVAMIVVGAKRPAVGLTVVGVILLAFGCVAFVAAVVLAL
jgi:hypothetical protein